MIQWWKIMSLIFTTYQNYPLALNVLESQKEKMAALTLSWMGQPSFCHVTVALSFQIKICNLDRTKACFVATSLNKKYIFTRNWVTRLYHPTNDLHAKRLCFPSNLPTQLYMLWCNYTHSLFYFDVSFQCNVILM